VEAIRSRGVTVVLLYHDVAPRAAREQTGFGGPLAARYKLEPNDFAAHLDAIAGTGRRVGTFDPAGHAPPVALTFDDGGSSALAAAEALEQHGWRGHFFVVTGLIGEPGFLDSAEITHLARRGHVIGSHSHSHPTYMARLSRGELEREWATSRHLLGELIGVAPSTASVPGGMTSSAVVAAAESAGYRVLMTSEPITTRRDAGSLAVVGRFNIWNTTPASRAAAYAREARMPRAKLWVEWRAKSTTKRISPAIYQRFRRLRARTE
jgi:peptidoglycan/xylan/chitin deacetylase (PgdA/CDA1 family)